MDKTNKKAKTQRSLVKRPIQRSLLLSSIAFMLLLSVMLAFFSYRVFSKALYEDYDSRLTSAITYIEHNADADDLEQCLKTGTSSEKRDRMQLFLNIIVDDLGLEYIYIVIPDPIKGVMINVISATSAAEREAGEEDMLILEETDAYTAAELSRFSSFWGTDGVNFFEETSDYGSFYTGCKALKNSSGETIALICVDLKSSDLHKELNDLVIYSILSAVAVIGLFGLIIIIWLRKKVTNPLLALENSTRNFANRDKDQKDVQDFHFDMPDIKTRNEVEALGEAINKMAADMKAYVEEILTAESRIRETEQENLRLAEKAEAAAKIAALKETVSTLFMNMPAMTFSKDVRNGKYLSCNRAFAEYAHKENTDEIVGMTDEELFGKEAGEQFIARDKTALSMDKPYVFYEEVVDQDGRLRQMQTTKLKFTDPAGNPCILGMCVDITEINELKKESIKVKAAYEEARDASVTYSNIARALASDYAYLYYIDLKTDHFIEYSKNTQGEELVAERNGDDFFAESRKDAKVLLHADDYAAFVQIFTKESILHSIEKRGKFTFTYRLLVNGEPVYMNMKATMMENDEDHLIIGVNNIDAQMKYQEEYERVLEERITYARVTALSGDYICVYTVDPNTDKYIEYSATKDYEGLGLSKGGEDFFTRALEEGNRIIYEEDREKFATSFTKKKVLKEIRKNKMFTLTYRLMIQGVPTYVNAKAAIIEEKDGPQLIIGVSNIDAQIKKEEEYARTLSVERNKANLDALTGTKNKHAYVDFETELNRRIEEEDDVRFAVVVCDINDLKKVNDTYGHHKGDIYIKQASQIICDTFKHSPVFRIGGDEFAVIAQGKDYENINELMEKLAESNRKTAQTTEDVVLACGVAVFNNDKRVSAVFERADIKMYENKKKLKEE